MSLQFQGIAEALSSIFMLFIYAFSHFFGFLGRFLKIFFTLGRRDFRAQNCASRGWLTKPSAPIGETIFEIGASAPWIGKNPIFSKIDHLNLNFMGQGWLLTQINGFCRKESLKMVDWKEREHEDVDTQAMNDPNWLEALRACRLLQFFLMPGMRAQPELL